MLGLVAAAELADLVLGGRPLRVHAAAGLATAGFTCRDVEAVDWDDVLRYGAVVHDPSCPLTPPAFLAEAAAASAGVPLVAVRPVTDTVKTVAGEVVGATVDRDLLRVLAAPLVVPAGLDLPPPPARSLPALVSWLSHCGLPPALLDAPAEARRLHDASDVLLLAADLTSGT